MEIIRNIIIIPWVLLSVVYLLSIAFKGDLLNKKVIDTFKYTTALMGVSIGVPYLIDFLNEVFYLELNRLKATFILSGIMIASVVLVHLIMKQK